MDHRLEINDIDVEMLPVKVIPITWDLLKDITVVAYIGFSQLLVSAVLMAIPKTQDVDF